MSEPNSGPPIELPDEGQLAEVAALVEAEAEAQDAIADNLIEQILLVWFAFSVLEGVRPGAQFYDGLSVADFGRQVSRLVIAAQQAAGQTTEAYLREQFERMGEDLPDRTVVDLPEDLRLGAAAADVYQRPIRQIRYWQSVDMPLEEAVDRATDRLERQALADLQLARTTASQQLFFVTNPERITGWRRIIHPELGNVCGLCIAASDRVYRRIERMDLHPGCKCTTLPITVESDPGRNLNAEDLRRLYEAAGSTATEALREVRVEVQQNGELGDILTPKQIEMRGPAQVNRQLSDRARQLRREQIERQIAELRARPRRSQWFDDRILQLEDLLETA